MKSLLKVIMFFALLFTLYWVISCVIGWTFQTDVMQIIRCGTWAGIFAVFGGMVSYYVANNMVNSWFKPKDIYRDKFKIH